MALGLPVCPTCQTIPVTWVEEVGNPLKREWVEKQTWGGFLVFAGVRRSQRYIERLNETSILPSVPFQVCSIVASFKRPLVKGIRRLGEQQLPGLKIGDVASRSLVPRKDLRIKLLYCRSKGADADAIGKHSETHSLASIC